MKTLISTKPLSSLETPLLAVLVAQGSAAAIDPGAMGKIPLIAMSENSFSMEGNVVEFLKDPNGEVTRVVQHWTEGDRSASRKK